MSEIIPIFLEFMNVASNANSKIMILNQDVGWSIGKNFIECAGLSLTNDSQQQNHYISRLGVSHSLLSISTYSETGSSELSNFKINLFLKYLGDSSIKERLITGFSTVNDECEITYAVGDISGRLSHGFFTLGWESVSNI